MEVFANEELQLSIGPLDPLREFCPRVINGKGLLVLGAHPDDEVIGAGGQVPQWTEAVFMHVTDGAPRDMSDAMRQGFYQRETYARARQEELQLALDLAGIESTQVRELGFIDQETCKKLPQLVEQCLDLFRLLKPLAVLTHPYEGGHPDHDSTAFSVHTACKMLKHAGELCPTIIEMTSYQNEAGSMQTRQFLFSANRHPVISVLTPEQSRLKKQMIDCFQSQRTLLQWFPMDFESFRLAPDYDFLQPPHPGVLYYELFNRGTSGAEWRERATDALLTLGLSRSLPSVTQPEVETWWRMAG